MTNIKLPYGLSNEQVVSIDDVESGLKCNCVCPSCKSQLIARKGEEKQHHFAHYNSEDCGWKGESIIHKISKEIFLESKTLRLSQVLWSYKPELVIYGETSIPIDNVKLECRIDDIIPDVIIESKGKELLVEIKVSHGIGHEKFQKINRLNISTLEIDVRRIVANSFRDNNYFLKSKDFKNALINGIDNKYWIYNWEKERIKQLMIEEKSKTLPIKLLDTSWKFEDLYYIDNCPIEKRTWNSGFKEGEPYANYNEDCRKCNYFLGQCEQNKPIHSKNGAIYCIGHLSETEYVINGFIFNNKKKINYKM